MKEQIVLEQITGAELKRRVFDAAKKAGAADDWGFRILLIESKCHGLLVRYQHGYDSLQHHTTLMGVCLKPVESRDPATGMTASETAALHRQGICPMD